MIIGPMIFTFKIKHYKLSTQMIKLMKQANSFKCTKDQNSYKGKQIMIKVSKMKARGPDVLNSEFKQAFKGKN